MVAIIDPSGTPVILYRDPAITIISINAAGSDASGATVITTVSQTTIVEVTTTSGSQGVKLPADAQDGDLIELYRVTGANNFTVYRPDGSVSVSAGSNTGALVMRKIPAGWAWIN